MRIYAAIEVEWIHFIMAYAGFIIHALLKLAALKKTKSFSFFRYVQQNIFSLLATIITIPVLLIVSTDPVISEMLPLNLVTATLAGWQTNSTFAGIMAIYARRIKTEENE